MLAAAFAAARGERLTRADAEIQDAVAAAIATRDWSGIVAAASGLWTETFEAEAGEAYKPNVLREFLDQLQESLERTSADPSADRIVKWVGTFTVNNATWNANRANAVPRNRWVTMRDAKVRDTHRAVAGTVVAAGGTFQVGDSKLHYPGEPIGDPANWIECRCLLQGVGRGRAVSTSFDIDTDGTEPETAEEITHAGLAVRALDTGRVLMLQRGLSDEEDPARGKWEFPGGSIEEGETPAAAAQREWSEEVGMPVPDGTMAGTWLANGMYAGYVLDVVDESMVTPHDGRDLVPNPDNPEGDEVEAVAWWTPTDLVDNPVIRAELADTLDLVFTALDAGNHPPQGTIGAEGGDMGEQDAVVADAGVMVGEDEEERAEAVAPVNDDEPAEDEEQGDVDEALDIPIHGVAAPLNATSGDGRAFVGEVTTRQLPLPFWILEGSQHGMAPVPRLAGRLDRLWVEEGLIKFEGMLEAGNQAAEDVVKGLAFGNIRSVSVDLGDVAMQLSATETWNGQPVQEMTMVEIAGLTAVGIGAFKEAWLALGLWADDEISPDAPIEELEDGPMLAAMFAAEVITAAEAGVTDAEMDELLGFAQEWGVVDLTELEPDALAAYEALDSQPDAQTAWLLENHPECIVASAVPAIVASAGLGFDLHAYAPGTHDGPGWITNPVATERIREYWVRGEGAAKVRWGVPGDFNRCRRQLAKYVQNPDWLAGLCANMHKEALGVWPGQEDGARAASITILEPEAITASAAVRTNIPKAWFENPQLTKVTPLTITPEGRVYGHLAAWGVCHVGIPGVCSTPAASASGYMYAHTGVVDTDEGPVKVGHLSAGIEHAPIHYNPAAAIAHYDRPDSIFADVVYYEDAIGIAYAGATRDISEERIREIRATGAMSGDWRRIRGALELISAVNVVVPGYPLPTTSFAVQHGEQTALVAAGIVSQDAVVASANFLPSEEEFAGLVRAVAEEIEYRAQRAERLATARKLDRQIRLEHARSLVLEEV